MIKKQYCERVNATCDINLILSKVKTVFLPVFRQIIEVSTNVYTNETKITYRTSIALRKQLTNMMVWPQSVRLASSRSVSYLPKQEQAAVQVCEIEFYSIIFLAF